MSVKSKSILALIAAIFSSAAFAEDPAATAPMPKEFQIVLSRPMAAGDIYEIDEKISVNRTFTKIAADGKNETKDPRSMELSGTMAISAVDQGGFPAEFTVKVKNLSGMGGKDEQRRQYVPDGTEIIVKRTDKETTFSVPAPAVGEAAKVELSEDAKIALSMLYPNLNASRITDDEVFPAKGPRKVNDRWEADVTSITQQAAGDNVKIDPKLSMGSATLLAARKTDTGISLTLQTKIEAAIISVGSLPPGVRLTDSWMKAKNVLIIPADPKIKSYKQELEETLEFKSNGTENGKPIIQSMVLFIQHSQTINQVKTAK